MSDAQLKAAVKLVRNMCQPKTKATNGKYFEKFAYSFLMSFLRGH
jgi:hypothetical protein